MPRNISYQSLDILVTVRDFATINSQSKEMNFLTLNQGVSPVVDRRFYYGDCYTGYANFLVWL